MSHVINYAPGAIEQKIRHLGCLSLAASCLAEEDCAELVILPGSVIGADGKLYRDGKLVTTGNMHYRTWKDDHNGRLVGDWDLPTGMTAAQVGENAIAVIRLTEKGKAKVKPGNYVDPYEVGVIPQVDAETGEVTYSLAHDFFAGGYGLEEVIGKTKTSGKHVVEAHGELLMYYQAMCAKIAAEEAGHSVEFHKESDGSLTVCVDKEEIGAA